MPRVAKTFKRLLKVKPVIDNLTLIQNPCGKVANMHVRYLNEGVSADIIIFITLDDPDRINNGTLASAFHCLQDEKIMRPLSGFDKYNPNFETG